MSALPPLSRRVSDALDILTYDEMLQFFDDPRFPEAREAVETIKDMVNSEDVRLAFRKYYAMWREWKYSGATP